MFFLCLVSFQSQKIFPHRSHEAFSASWKIGWGKKLFSFPKTSNEEKKCWNFIEFRRIYLALAVDKSFIFPGAPAERKHFFLHSLDAFACGEKLFFSFCLLFIQQLFFFVCSFCAWEKYMFVDESSEQLFKTKCERAQWNENALNRPFFVQLSQSSMRQLKRAW